MSFDPSGRWSPPTAVTPSDLHAALPSGLPFDSLVPLFTIQSPTKLLDRYYASRRPSDEGGDPKGALAPPPQRQDREVLGDILDVPVSLPPSLSVSCEIPCHGLSAVSVPRYGENPAPGGSQVVVEFKSRDQQGPSTGVELAHLFGEGADPTKLQGAQDIVLDTLRGRDLELIISWPGYQCERYMIRVHAANGGSLTRFDLGKQITLAYAFFFFKIERDSLLPSATGPGFYNIALHQGQNRRWDTPGIQLLQLRLVKFRNTAGGSWIAEVEIVL